MDWNFLVKPLTMSKIDLNRHVLLIIPKYSIDKCIYKHDLSTYTQFMKYV
jgi:hypothetical protein